MKNLLKNFIETERKTCEGKPDEGIEADLASYEGSGDHTLLIKSPMGGWELY